MALRRTHIKRTKAALKPIIITTCTNRKKRAPVSDLKAENLAKGSLEDIASSWWQRVGAQAERLPVAEMYAGRGFSEAKMMASETGGELYVISAGLGLVAAGDEIPAYDLTLVPRTKGDVRAKISEPITASDWWGALNELAGHHYPITDLVRRHSKRLVLAALSQNYLNMVSEDLCQLTDDELRRLRLFGLRDINSVPQALRKCVMPYTENFDGPESPRPGTRGDFAQRTLWHFWSSMPAEIALDDVQSQRKFIEGLMGSWPLPKKIAREQKTDDEIIEIVPQLWDRANGSVARMLRVLRDEELIACEQGRFAALFKQAKERHSLP